MNNVFKFLWRNHIFFLFLLLEIFSFSLIIKNNFYQKSIVFNSSNFVSSRFLNTVSSIIDYLYLKDANQQLAKENAWLKSMHKSSYIFDNRISFVLDSVDYYRKFAFLPAKVISNTINRQNNFFTINIGANDGVLSGMGVVSPTGTAGIVKDVSGNYASVYSLLHEDIKISGKVGADNAIGTVKSNNKDYKSAKLFDISKYLNVEIGDTVFSTDFSQIFPPNIPIGTIIKFEVNDASDFYDIDINFLNDFSKISYVYVVKINKTIEQIELEEANNND